MTEFEKETRHRLYVFTKKETTARTWRFLSTYTCLCKWRGFFDRTRSGYEHNASFKSDNMQNKHGGSIRLLNCYLKRRVKNSLTQYSFYVKESKLSSRCTRNIHRPSRPEKEANRKENTVQKITKRRHMTRQIRKFTLHYVMLWNKENRDLRARFIVFLLVDFLRFAGLLNICVPFLVSVNKNKIHKTKFEIEEENTKLQIACKLPM